MWTRDTAKRLVAAHCEAWLLHQNIFTHNTETWGLATEIIKMITKIELTCQNWEIKEVLHIILPGR